MCWFWRMEQVSKRKKNIHKPISKQRTASKSWLFLSSIHSCCQCWRKTLLKRGESCKNCWCLTWLLKKQFQHLAQVTQMNWKLYGKNIEKRNHPGVDVSVSLAFTAPFSFEGWGFQKSTCQFWFLFKIQLAKCSCRLQQSCSEISLTWL